MADAQGFGMAMKILTLITLMLCVVYCVLALVGIMHAPLWLLLVIAFEAGGLFVLVLKHLVELWAQKAFGTP